MMKMKQDNNVTNRNGAFYTKSELRCRNRLDSVRFIMKIGQDNNVIDHTGAVYAKIITELSWSIR